MKYLRRTLLTSAVFIALGHTAYAVEIPHTFTAGATAKADEVNANFAALATAVQALQAEVTTIKEERDAALARIDVLEQQLTEAEPFLALKDYVTLEPDPYILNEYTVLFSGVNVQLVNGTGATRNVNGLGNLIVGYNEARSGSLVCSDGSKTTEEECTTSGGVWASNHKSGSHNIVGGAANAYSRAGGLVVGVDNVIITNYSTVTGGLSNTASGVVTSISGGTENIASGWYSSVSGGRSNVASGNQATVSGGENNTASGSQTSVSGGKGNTASGQQASVSGGTNNDASAFLSTILGGEDNLTTQHWETIPASP